MPLIKGHIHIRRQKTKSKLLNKSYKRYIRQYICLGVEYQLMLTKLLFSLLDFHWRINVISVKTKKDIQLPSRLDDAFFSLSRLNFLISPLSTSIFFLFGLVSFFSAESVFWVIPAFSRCCGFSLIFFGDYWFKSWQHFRLKPFLLSIVPLILASLSLLVAENILLGFLISRQLKNYFC